MFCCPRYRTMTRFAKDQLEANDDFQLIPTSMRLSLSKELSFPVGAELVSKALHGVLNYEELWLDFTAYGDRGIPPRVRQMVQNNEPLIVLDVVGSNISVKPVPRENKWVVRNMICDLGLPRLRHWFIDFKSWSDNEPDPFQYRRCNFSVCIADEKIHFWEGKVRGYRPRRQ